jgi:nicotinamidase-related amidase
MYCWGPDGERKSLPPDDKVFDDWLDADRSAVVCIDMHRSHVGDDPDTPARSLRATGRVDAHNSFHAAARAIGVPIVMVQHMLRRDGRDDVRSAVAEGGTNWRHTSRLFFEDELDTLDELGLEGTTWTDLMVETDRERDLYVRTKRRLSAFYPTDLEFTLRQRGIANLVLTGTLTDCCVLNTAFDAANRDFRVLVPRDVAAGLSEEMEAAALAIVASHLGLVVDAPAVIEEWYARKRQEVTPALGPRVRLDRPT